MTDSLTLATIRDDTWNVLNMQYITPNTKRWDYSDILVVAQKINGPAHMVDGGHHLRNSPHPTRFYNTRIDEFKYRFFWWITWFLSASVLTKPSSGEVLFFLPPDLMIAVANPIYSCHSRPHMGMSDQWRGEGEMPCQSAAWTINTALDDGRGILSDSGWIKYIPHPHMSVWHWLTVPKQTISPANFTDRSPSVVFISVS